MNLSVNLLPNQYLHGALEEKAKSYNSFLLDNWSMMVNLACQLDWIRKLLDCEDTDLINKFKAEWDISR